RLVARAGVRLGGRCQEGTSVEGVDRLDRITGGFRITLQSSEGRSEVTARMVVNAGGAWSSANLLRWGWVPRTTCLLNVGSHLVFAAGVVPADPSACAAALLEHDDGRVVFFIPWQGTWLLGTTDSELDGTPERWGCPPG